MDFIEEYWPVLLAGGAAVLILSLCVYAAIVDNDQWQIFSKQHDCKVVGKRNGYYTYGSGIGSDGKSVSVNQYHPGETTYKCNDGVEYTR